MKVTPTERVVFSYEPKDGKHDFGVWVAGEFNDWIPQRMVYYAEVDAYVAAIELPVGRTYAYRFKVGDDWVLDEGRDNTRKNAMGTEDSVLTVGSLYTSNNRRTMLAERDTRFPAQLIEDVESVKNKLGSTVVIVNAGGEGNRVEREHKSIVKRGEYSLFERTLNSLYEMGIRNVMVTLRESSKYYDVNEVKRIVSLAFKDMNIKIVPADVFFHLSYTRALEAAGKEGFKYALCVFGTVLPHFEAYAKALYSLNDRVVVVAKGYGRRGLQARTDSEGRITEVSMDYEDDGPYAIAWMLNTSDASKLRNMKKPSLETLVKDEYGSWNAISAVYPKEIGFSFNARTGWDVDVLGKYLSKNPLPSGFRGVIDGELLSIVSALNPKAEPDAGDAAKPSGKVAKGILSLLRKLRLRL